MKIWGGLESGREGKARPRSERVNWGNVSRVGDVVTCECM